MSANKRDPTKAGEGVDTGRLVTRGPSVIMVCVVMGGIIGSPDCSFPEGDGAEEEMGEREELNEKFDCIGDGEDDNIGKEESEPVAELVADGKFGRELVRVGALVTCTADASDAFKGADEPTWA